MARVRYCKDLFVVSFYSPSAVFPAREALAGLVLSAVPPGLSRTVNPFCVCVCVCVHAGMSSGHLLVAAFEVLKLKMCDFYNFVHVFVASFLPGFLPLCVCVCVCVCVVWLQNSHTNTHTHLSLIHI